MTGKYSFLARNFESFYGTNPQKHVLLQHAFERNRCYRTKINVQFQKFHGPHGFLNLIIRLIDAFWPLFCITSLNYLADFASI